MPELQDLYDIHRKPTGEVAQRGMPIPEGRYRLGVQVWIRNDAGQFLLSQRHPCKKKPLYWEPTGGAVDAGEDTRAAGVREVREELGVSLEPKSLELIRTTLRSDVPEFLDAYLACWNGSIEELKLQENEVVDARWADYDELAELESRGVFAEDYRGLFGYVQKTPAAVCEMRPADYDEVIRLWHSMPGMGLNNLDDSREGIERFLRRNPGTSFVVRTAEGLMGSVLCGNDGRRGYLYHLAVSPELQGRGLGRALVQSALDALRREGISKAGLMVFVSNEAAGRFWDRMGFSDRSDVRYRSIRLFEMEEIHT